MDKKYNIGLDIGTTSVGWAVVEEDTQKIIRKGKGNERKALWGVRLFEEATTAEARRGFRSTRRRYDRRRNRIKLLQEEFKEEINKVDKNFFKKLEESKYNEKDKNNKTILLTSSDKEQIKNYNDKYKTIYHLRKELMEVSEQKDIRLVYLALHHIIKYRGNFLYNTETFNTENLNVKDNILNLFNTIIDLVPELEIPEEFDKLINLSKLEEEVLESSKNDVKVNVKNRLIDVSTNKKFATEFSKMIVGNKFNIKDLLMVDTDEKIVISFDDTDYEEKYQELEEKLGDLVEIIDLLKVLYDTVFLKKLFKGSKNTNISSLMVDKYEIHKKDLEFLKRLFKSNRKIYNKIFKTNKNYTCLYDEYIHNKISYEDFKKELQKNIENLFDSLEDNNIKAEYLQVHQLRIENGEFLPKITSTENGKYPYQLNKDELIKIIENQGKYYPFLLNKINDKYKLVKLLEFKIPYFVGPLVSDEKSENAWLEKNIEHVKITPYNFDEVVNKELTAEKFIKRMISHCTYLLNEYALPNNSILYSKYKVMNELKQIKVNGDKLTLEIQQKIIDDLFKRLPGSITDKKIKTYLYSLPEFVMYGNDINITGYSADGKFANNMQSYIDFFGENGFFKDTNYNESDADNIIEWITIFDDKDILEKKVRNNYNKLNDSQIKSILSKKYSGWGNLSKKLLTTKYYKDKETGIFKSILDLMTETEKNFMQILNEDEYKFQQMIKENNVLKEENLLNYELVKNLATSPATKRGIYQSLKVIKEIVDYMGHEPENIMIEMARGEEKNKKRKDTKKDYLINLYKNTKKDIENYEYLYNKLNSFEKIDKDELFLYFIQEGKCLYTGTPLNIEDLSNCEIDHIIPRTLIKDNSIDNKALVLRECNRAKSASFVLPSEYRTPKQIAWWKRLNKYNLISSKKFYRLTRKSYSDEDIEGFINRQLVETRQITKHVANILNNFYKETKIVYLKANLSHDYRQKYELYKFRELNDYHHAYDAYLTAVLGEYKEKYMKRNVNFEMVKELNKYFKDNGQYKELKYGYVLNSLDTAASDIILKISKKFVNEETGELLFDPERFNKVVEDTYYRNDILVSRKTEIRSGQLFKQTILPKEKGNIKIKENMPTEMYGGYTSMETSYMTLVKYKNKLKLIGIPSKIANTTQQNSQAKKDFIKEHLKLKNDEEIEIVKDNIPYETLIKYRNQNVYIKGYSNSNRVCELANAYQFKLPKPNTKQWKSVLNEMLNIKNVIYTDEHKIDDAKKLEIAKEIVTYLLNEKEEFPLFNKEITKIKEQLNIEELTFNDLSKVISEILKIYHCNSVNGNLKDYGLGNRIGRLSGFNIDSGELIFASVTGLKQTKCSIDEWNI